MTSDTREIALAELAAQTNALRSLELMEQARYKKRMVQASAPARKRLQEIEAEDCWKVSVGMQVVHKAEEPTK